MHGNYHHTHRKLPKSGFFSEQEPLPIHLLFLLVVCWLRSVHHFLCTYHYRRQTVECTHMQVGLLSKEDVNLLVQVNLQFGLIGCPSTQAGAVFGMT